MKTNPPFNAIQKKAKRGFKGYPLATLMFYGSDDKRATKVSVGIILGEGQPVAEMRRWSHSQDVRSDFGIAREIGEFMTAAAVKSVVMTAQINGCPHEEGIDYDGEVCPRCPFWAGRDRWSGKKVIN